MKPWARPGLHGVPPAAGWLKEEGGGEIDWLPIIGGFLFLCDWLILKFRWATIMVILKLITKMGLWQLRDKYFFFAICLPPAEQRAADWTWLQQYPAGGHLGHVHGVRWDHWTLVSLSRARRNSCLPACWPRTVFLPTQRGKIHFLYVIRQGGLIHHRCLIAGGGWGGLCPHN